MKIENIKNAYYANKSGFILLIFLIIIVFYFIYLFSYLEPAVKAGIIAALVAIFIPFLSNIIQKKRELDFKIREKKIDSYTKIFDFFREFVSNIKQGEIDENLIVTQNREVTYSLLLYGSEKIIRLWSDFWESNIAMSTFPVEDQMEQTYFARARAAYIIKEIRNDLGYIDSNIDINMYADLYMPINFDSEEQKYICYIASLSLQVDQDKKYGK